MLFIILSKFRHKPTKQELDKMNSYYAELAKQGTKVTQIFWTLGRYDAVLIVEGRDEKAALQSLMNSPMEIATETLVAVPREEAIKLLK
jgi:uncharacterized protein with GYD domain